MRTVDELLSDVEGVDEQFRLFHVGHAVADLAVALSQRRAAQPS